MTGSQFGNSQFDNSRKRRTLHCKLHRSAFSLLEVVAGMVVVGMILVPATSMMRDALKGEATQRSRSELLQLAHGKSAEYAHLARIQFRDRNANGAFTTEGYPQMMFTVQCSQDPANGGVTGRYLAISTFAWHDQNGNRTFDVNEPSVSLWTGVARATP